MKHIAFETRRTGCILIFLYLKFSEISK